MLELGEYNVPALLYAPLTTTSNMDDIVIIVVAEDNSQKFFNIDQTLLDQKAPGFLKTINPLGSRENSPLHLTNVEIPTFELFVKWLDTDPTNNRHSHTGAPLHLAFEERAWERMMPAINAYIFGERYSIPALCNDALFHLSAFIQAHLHATKSLTNLDRWVYDKELAHQETTYAYANTGNDSKLRQFFVDAYRAMHVPKIASSFPTGKYPEGFRMEVMTYKGKLNYGLYPYSAQSAADRVKQWQRDGMEIAPEVEEDRRSVSLHQGGFRAAVERMKIEHERSRMKHGEAEMENAGILDAERGEMSETTDTGRTESPGYLMGAWRWMMEQSSRAGVNLGILNARE
jgi:IS1 family transposase